MKRKLSKKERDHLRWLMDRGIDGLRLSKAIKRRETRVSPAIVDTAERLVELLAAEFQGLIVSESDDS